MPKTEKPEDEKKEEMNLCSPRPRSSRRGFWKPSKSEKIKEMIENGHKDWTFATGGPFLGALQEKLKAVKEPKSINKDFMSTFLAEDSKQVRTRLGISYLCARLQEFMGLEGVIKKLEEEHSRLVETRIAQQRRYSSP